jgi:hypothetical protein
MLGLLHVNGGQKVIKTKGLGYEGTPSQKREREKSFLSSQSIKSYLQNPFVD